MPTSLVDRYLLTPVEHVGINTRSGMCKPRLRGPISASPILVGDTIDASNKRATTFVFKATPQHLLKQKQQPTRGLILSTRRHVTSRRQVAEKQVLRNSLISPSPSPEASSAVST